MTYKLFKRVNELLYLKVQNDCIRRKNQHQTVQSSMLYCTFASMLIILFANISIVTSASNLFYWYQSLVQFQLSLCVQVPLTLLKFLGCIIHIHLQAKRTSVSYFKPLSDTLSSKKRVNPSYCTLM